jgi:hypothetical protein
MHLSWHNLFPFRHRCVNINVDTLHRPERWRLRIQVFKLQKTLQDDKKRTPVEGLMARTTTKPYVWVTTTRTCNPSHLKLGGRDVRVICTSAGMLKLRGRGSYHDRAFATAKTQMKLVGDGTMIDEYAMPALTDLVSRCRRE